MQPEPETPGWPTLIKELTYFMIKSKQTWLRWSNIKQLQQHNAEAGQLMFFSSLIPNKIKLVIQLKVLKTFFSSAKPERQTEIYSCLGRSSAFFFSSVLPRPMSFFNLVTSTAMSVGG